MSTSGGNAEASRAVRDRLRLRTMLGSLLMLAVVYLGLCAALFVFQRSLIYFPQRGDVAPSALVLKLPAPVGDVLVSGRALDGPNALVYFGGNAEDVTYSLPGFAAAFPDHALFLMHYRGYRGSAGSPSEAGLVEDGLALFDKVREQHSHVVVVGRSLGSGVAVQVASRRPAARLVLVTPFDSLEGVAASHYPIFPVRWLLRDTYRSRDHAPRVTAPTTIIAAAHDEVIPRESAELLVTRFAKGVATIEVLPGVGHNTIEQSARYWLALKG
jgi:uncharacterized protein